VAPLVQRSCRPVWTESTLSTLGDWTSTTFSDSINTTHVVYATFDGSAWSDPADLTTPSGGEGNVALAGCLSTDPTCPNGGEVTTVGRER
jgi:hypothetical protein